MLHVVRVLGTQTFMRDARGTLLSTLLLTLLLLSWHVWYFLHSYIFFLGWCSILYFMYFLVLSLTPCFTLLLLFIVLAKTQSFSNSSAYIFLSQCRFKLWLSLLVAFESLVKTLFSSFICLFSLPTNFTSLNLLSSFWFIVVLMCLKFNIVFKLWLS